MKLRAFGQGVNLAIAGILMLAIWALLVWVGSRPALKRLVDLSPQQRSTVDPLTVELLQGLAAQSVQVEFHTFFDPSGETPQDVFQQQRQQILVRLRELTRMLLRQYAFHGDQAVRVVDHEPYGDIASYREAAQRYGITQTDVVVVAVRKSGRPPRHRTLSLEADLGVVEVPQQQQQTPVPRAVVPVLKDYKGEEAISSALKSLLVTGTPVVYFLDGYTNDDLLSRPAGDGYLRLGQMLEGLGIDWRRLTLRNGVIPKDATVVAVLEPTREFSANEARILLDYLQRGGRLFLNYSYSQLPDYNITGGDLGRALGFEIGTRQVMHMIVNSRDPGGRGIDGNDGVTKLDLLLNPNHPVTLRLAGSRQLLQFAQARELRLVDPAPTGVRRDALLATGQSGWLGFTDQNGFPDFHAPPGQLASYVLGAAFDLDGKGADEKPVTGVAFVTSGMFCNNLGMGINGNLAANIFNWLCERREFMDIRGSSYVPRHLQLQQAQLDRIFWFLVAGVPGTLLMLGMIVAWRRRRA